jgi:hypothetical protein
MTSPPGYVAAFDSATAMVMANAASLRGEPFPALGNPPALKPIAKHAHRLPAWLREKLFIVSGATETISPRRVDRLDLSEIDEWLAEEYPPGPYPAVAVGSSNGALLHLYAALGIPFLPQTLLFPVRERVHPDDPIAAMENGIEPGRRLVEAYPDLQLHHMHDAAQDRLMVRVLTYFRVKRRVLGEGYERFLRERLQPGGTILVPDCRQRWQTTRISERHVFQHGAVGGATEEEFHEGSERVADYLRRYDSPVRRWDGPEPDTDSPEAEWGFETALLDDIERFAAEHGYRVERISFDEPTDPSPLVADLHRWWYRRRRIPANRLIVSSFVLAEPYWTARTGSVPYWMTFNMGPSYRALEHYLDEAEPFDEIHLMLFQHGVDAVDFPPGDDWKRLLDKARRRGTTLGVRLDEHPLDFSHFAKYDDAIQAATPARYPLTAPLTLGDLREFLRERGDRYAVEFTDLTPDRRSQHGAQTSAAGRERQRS